MSSLDPIATANEKQTRREGMTREVIGLRPYSLAHGPGTWLDAVTIKEPRDIAFAARAIACLAKVRQLRIMAWHDISSTQPMVDDDGLDLNATVFGWGANSCELWRDVEKSSRSPIIRACRVEGEPFWLNRHGFRSAWNNPFLDRIDLEDLEKRSLLRAAIVIPMHLPFAQVAAIAISSVDNQKDDLSAEFAQFGSLLTDASRRFLAGYVSCRQENPYLPDACVLTSREVECLRWAAFGKTDDEISIILARSHAAIRYRIKRVCEKLGAANRAQAIFRACQLGYLGSAT